MPKLGEYIIDRLSNSMNGAANKFIDRIHEETDFILSRVENRALNFQRKVIKTALYMATFTAVGVFGILAVFYALKEFALFNNTASFLVVGILTLFIGIILKLQVKGGDYNYGARYK